MTIKKTPIPDISGMFNKDGTPNLETIHAVFGNAFDQHAAGHFTITGSASQKTAADGGVDAVINFHRSK